MEKEIKAMANWWAKNLFAGDVSEVFPHIDGFGPVSEEQVKNFEKALIKELERSSHGWTWEIDFPELGAIYRILTTTYIRNQLSIGVSDEIIKAAYRAMIPGVMHRLPKDKSTFIYPGKVSVQTIGIKKHEVIYEDPKKRPKRGKTRKFYI